MAKRSRAEAKEVPPSVEDDARTSHGTTTAQSETEDNGAVRVSHECDVCGKIYTKKDALRRHLFTHKRQHAYTCPDCGKTFSQKGHLVVHLRTHTGEKPFKCSSCTAAFKQKVTLDRHILRHTGEKPHKCYDCGRRFARKDHLCNHIRSCKHWRLRLIAVCTTILFILKVHWKNTLAKHAAAQV